MIKVYRNDRSVISVNVDIQGRRIPVRFTAENGYNQFNRGSYFKTDSEFLQNALESSGNFGQLYYLDAEETDALNGVTVDGEAMVEEKKELQTVTVASIADAKAWLQENKGWNPKTRVSSKRIIEVAAEYGIQFDGLEIQ